MRKPLGVFASLLLSCIGIVAFTVPASAVIDPNKFQVCNSTDGFTNIRVFSISGSYSVVLAGGGDCTNEISPSGIRVDTDPYGTSHSYKIKVEGGSYGPCHTNSDNHESDPPNAYGKKVYYKNYDHGDCTN